MTWEEKSNPYAGSEGKKCSISKELHQNEAICIIWDSTIPLFLEISTILIQQKFCASKSTTRYSYPTEHYTKSQPDLGSFRTAQHVEINSVISNMITEYSSARILFRMQILLPLPVYYSLILKFLPEALYIKTIFDDRRLKLSFHK